MRLGGRCKKISVFLISILFLCLLTIPVFGQYVPYNQLGAFGLSGPGLYAFDYSKNIPTNDVPPYGLPTRIWSPYLVNLLDFMLKWSVLETLFCYPYCCNSYGYLNWNNPYLNPYGGLYWNNPYYTYY